MDNEYKKYLEALIKDGWHIQLGENEEILFMWYWHPEVLVSKIILKDDK